MNEHEVAATRPVVDCGKQISLGGDRIIHKNCGRKRLPGGVAEGCLRAILDRR